MFDRHVAFCCWLVDMAGWMGFLFFSEITGAEEKDKKLFFASDSNVYRWFTATSTQSVKIL